MKVRRTLSINLGGNKWIASHFSSLSVCYEYEQGNQNYTTGERCSKGSAIGDDSWGKLPRAFSQDLSKIQQSICYNLIKEDCLCLNIGMCKSWLFIFLNFAVFANGIIKGLVSRRVK